MSAHTSHLEFRDFVSPMAFSAAAMALKRSLERSDDVLASKRQSVPVPGGEMLLMPAIARGSVGVKILTVLRTIDDESSPRIKGLFALFNADTLAPIWSCDAAPLTLLRTAALSAVAVTTVCESVKSLTLGPSHKVLVYGTGPQAYAHILGFSSLLGLNEFGVVGRSEQKSRDFISLHKKDFASLSIFSARPNAVQSAGLILCCTSAKTPVLRDVREENTVLVAIGSHSPDTRELPAGVLKRSTVILDGESAKLAAGDLVQAQRDLGRAVPSRTLGSLVRGEHPLPADGPWVVKSVGEGWQDVAVASAMYQREAREGSDG